MPGDPPRLEFFEQRPGQSIPTGPLTSPRLSRRQLRIHLRDGALHIESVGKRALLHNGVQVSQCKAKIGDTIGIEGVALLLIDSRPDLLAGPVNCDFDFGSADAFGVVGETPEVWMLRRTVRDVALAPAHVLILGASGTGKEAVARSLHQQSKQGRKDLVSRNAASIPETLIEAELFGNAPNYPNAGMPARPGLIGAADGTTLFLDEIAELGQQQQANLLRVLDAGEYQRLGEEQTRRSRFRLIAATNRPPESLKPDFLARFAERIEVPCLTDRRGDVPLLIRHVIESDDAFSRAAQPTPELVELLVRHQYSLNYRELERLLRLALRGSGGGLLQATEELTREICLPSAAPSDGELAEADIRAALAGCPTVGEAARSLGLPSRYALYRQMRKWGIER